MLFLLLQACQKETNQPISDYKIQEYFAPENSDVKQTILDFLYAAGRINTVASKSEENTLEDKDPNEGVWLMEAAVNLERYNDFSYATTYKKEFNIEIANKVLPDGIIKMDAADIISKYNDLLAQIIAEETGSRFAKLIDFQIQYVTASFTGVRVVTLFGGGDDDIIGAPWIGDEPGENSPSFCGYIYPNYPQNFNLNWDMSYIPNNYGLSSNEGTRFHYFINKAIEANIIVSNPGYFTIGTYPPVTLSYADFERDIPFSTNVYIFNQGEILLKLKNEIDFHNSSSGMDFSYLYSNYPNPESPSEWNQLLGCYSEMVNIVKNSIYQPIPFKCIFSLIDHQPYNHHSAAKVVFLVYALTHNG